MERKKILKIIKTGEGLNAEFKSSLSGIDRIVEILASFANARGGIVLVGVSDSRQVIGVDIGKQTIERLTDCVVDNTDPKIYPEIVSFKINNKNIIMVKVEESHDKPHLASGRAFIRVGKNTKPMSRSQYEKLLINRSKKDIQYDSEICRDAKLNDIDWQKVKWFKAVYREITGKAISSTDKKLLESLGCIKNGKILSSAVLLFGKRPEKNIPQNQITVVRYPGEKVSDRYLDIKDFCGNLFELIDKTDGYIKEHIQIASRLIPEKVPREEIPEYPLYAIRELVVNAVAHRDYLISGSRIIIKMFKNRIEYFSPGGFPAGITAKNIMDKQSSRNPVLVKVLSSVKYIEAIGDGVDRIFATIKSHPLKPKLPVFKDVGEAVIATLFAADLGKLREKRIEVKLNKRQEKALDYLRTKERITRREYVDLNKISKRMANKDLKQLEKAGVIIPRGAGRSIYYILGHD